MGKTRLALALALAVIAAIAFTIPVTGGIARAAALSASRRASIRRVAMPLSLNERLARSAKHLEGVRYVYGGTSAAGFDCSGLTQYVYREYGRAIQRTAQDQFREFRRISKLHAWGGDLVFFHVSRNPGSYVYHVGIYEGGHWMVAASTGAGHVEWESFAWAGDTVTFGTITH